MGCAACQRLLQVDKVFLYQSMALCIKAGLIILALQANLVVPMPAATGQDVFFWYESMTLCIKSGLITTDLHTAVCYNA